jgi:hypothetical protein
MRGKLRRREYRPKRETTGIQTPSRTVAGSDRALSDLVGFILAFAVILSGVAIVSTIGTDILEDIKGNQQANNAQQAFGLMAENFDEIENGRAPTRTSEINLHSGRLRATNSSNFTVRIERPSDPDIVRTVFTEQIRLRPDPGSNSVVVYENGASIRGKNSTTTGIVENRPTLTCQNEAAIVSLVRIDAPTNRQLGEGTVRISGTRTNSGTLYPFNRTGDNSSTHVRNANLTVDSSFEDAWYKHLTVDGNWTRYDDDTVSCQQVDRVYVRQTVINVSFVR